MEAGKDIAINSYGQVPLRKSVVADVLGHGGDGGNRPPHQSGNRLPTDCESVFQCH